jgi:hypothetical protein
LTAVLLILFWLVLPGLLLAWVGWIFRRQKRSVGLLIGIGLIIALMIVLWSYGIFEVERCVQTCSSGAPLDACRVSCNQESSLPFIYVGECLLLFDGLVFVFVTKFLNRQRPHRLNQGV